jgi:hypothetical protein
VTLQDEWDFYELRILFSLWVTSLPEITPNTPIYSVFLSVIILHIEVDHKKLRGSFCR